MKISKKFYREDDGRFSFWCPGCNISHQIDSRWNFNGNLQSPTISPSLLVTWNWGEERIEERCHSFIRDGKIEFLGDCLHKLKNQTVEIPEWEGRYL